MGRNTPWDRETAVDRSEGILTSRSPTFLRISLCDIKLLPGIFKAIQRNAYGNPGDRQGGKQPTLGGHPFKLE